MNLGMTDPLRARTIRAFTLETNVEVLNRQGRIPVTMDASHDRTRAETPAQYRPDRARRPWEDHPGRGDAAPDRRGPGRDDGPYGHARPRAREGHNDPGESG